MELWFTFWEELTLCPEKEPEGVLVHEGQLFPLFLPFTFKLSQKHYFLILGGIIPFSKRHVSIDACWNPTWPQERHFWECLEMFTLWIKTSRNSINKMQLSHIIIRRAFSTRQILWGWLCSLVAPVSFIFRVDTISSIYLVI